MNKELIEMAKLADMRLGWGCIHRNLDKCPCHDTEQENCVGIEPVKVITSFESLKEFHRLSTEKAVREALEKAALIAEEVNYHIGSKIRAIIEPVAGEKSCSHNWEDAGNQYFDNGDICTKCGATRR